MAERPTDPFQVLRQRGADAALIDLIARSGLSGEAVQRGVEAAGLLSRVRGTLHPRAPLSARERTRLTGIAELAREVIAVEPDDASAQKFWSTPMPWLGGRTPADTLARRDGIAVVSDLLARINFGIPP